MDSIQEAILKSLNPTSVIKVTDIDTGKVPDRLIEDVYQSVARKYKTSFDKRNGVIYVGKRV